MSLILDRLCDRIFLFGLLAAVCFTLWLPLFPTGDGPVHLYYADVLRSLLHHQPRYAHDYAIRHLFAPYLVHYLALITLERWVTPAKAEELFICLILVVTAGGFRALARTLGKQAGLACVWMLPLLFSWSLSGGFLNCCFATGVMLWAFAVWVRLGEPAPKRQTAARLGLFAVLLALLLLSHPVPLMVLLLFTYADLGLRVARAASLRGILPQLAALALTSCAFVAPVLTAQKGQAAAVLPGMGFHPEVLVEFITGMRLTMFAGLSAHSIHGWLNIAGRILLMAPVPAVSLFFLLGRRAHWESGQQREPAAGRTGLAWLPERPAGRLLLISLVYLAATLVFPRALNHSYFFPERMWGIAWLLVLACGAAIKVSRRTQLWIGAGAAASLLIAGTSGLPGIAQIARVQARIAAAPLPQGRGLLLEADAAGEERGLATSYPVYFWSGARAFQASGAILLNSPWLGLTILPVKDAPGPTASNALLDRGLPSLYSENPVTLTELLASPANAHEQALRRPFLERADFLLYIDPPPPLSQHGLVSATKAQIRALLGSDGSAWRCEPRDVYAVCTRAR